MKVLFVIDSLGRGGAERALLNLIAALKAIGVQPVIVPLGDARDLKSEFEQSGAEVVSLDFGYKWRLIKNTRILSRYITASKPDIIHAHLLFSGLYTGLTKYFGADVARVISFHNLAYAPGCNPRNFSFLLRKSLNRFVVNNGMDRLIAVSSAVAGHYSQNLGIEPGRFKVIPNGLPIGLLHQQTSVHIKTDKKIILALGRLVPEKGYEYLLQAYRELRETYSAPTELRIIGGGPLRQELQSLSEKLGVSDETKFLGMLEHSEAMMELRKADIFVTASIFEGFGLSVAEAILADIPVVATSVGGLRDVVKTEFAEIVVSADAAQLTQGIIRALSLSEIEREQRTRTAKDFVVSRFSVDSVAKQLKCLYLEELR